MVKRKKYILYIVIFILFLLSTFTISEARYKIENKEMKVKINLLPKFCLCAGFPVPCSNTKRQKYEEFYGPIFKDIHHFCFGLDKINNAFKKKNKVKRDFELNSAIKEFDYVLKHPDPKKRVHAAVWTKKGQTLILLEKNIEAEKCFLNAIKIYDSYIPPYIYLSEMQNSIGKTEQACKILKKALIKSPNSKIIQKKVNETCK